MDYEWIDDPDSLRSFCDAVGDAPALAVDTESDHYHAYNPQVCLIQLASRDRAALIDPLRLSEEDLRPLFELLEDSGVVKILHSARNDIGELDRDYGITIRNMFDTQVAAKFVQTERNSLDWLLEDILGVEPSGKFARFDWTMRPIPDDAAYYAVMDVAHLHELRDHLLGELEQSGWLEAFRQVCAYYAEATEYDEIEFDPDDWRRIRGSDDLDGRGRAALRELHAVRHEICERLNRAAVHVFDNSAIVDLARRRPTSVSGLRNVKGRIVAQVRHEDGEAIIDAIRRSLDAEIPPERRPRSNDGRRKITPEERNRYDALRSWRNEAAEREALPTMFVATNATLSEVARLDPQEVDDLAEVDALLPWQVERFGDEIIDTLRNA